MGHRLDLIKKVADGELRVDPVTLLAKFKADAGRGTQFAAIKRTFAQGVLDRYHTGTGGRI